MRKDLDTILKGPEKSEKKYYILAALSDLKQLLKTEQKIKSQTQSDFSKQFPESEIALVNKQKIKNCLRKLDYYLSFTKDCLEF